MKETELSWKQDFEVCESRAANAAVFEKCFVHFKALFANSPINDSILETRVQRRGKHFPLTMV